MNLRKALATTLAIPILTLAACSNNGDNSTTTTNNPSALPSENIAPQLPEKKKIKVGETFNINYPPGNNTDVTITKMTMGEQCHYGTNDYGGENDPSFGKLKQGDKYLQIWAIVNGKQVVNDAGKNWGILKDPEVKTKDGFTTQGGTSTDCKNSTDGYDSWSSTFDSGEKKRVYGAFEIPANAESVTVEDVEVSQK